MARAVKTNQPCPKCGSSDSMAVYEDGSGYCWSNCGYINKALINGTTESRTMSNNRSRWNLEEIGSFPPADLSHRGLKTTTVDKYRVVQAIKPESGEFDRQAIFFPAGTGEGYKRKNSLVKRDMEVLGDYVGLFGQQLFRQGGKFLCITEGEEDAMSLWQAFKEQGKDYSVCSLPSGAGCGGLDKREVWEYIASFEGVLLCFDDDDQGKAAVEKFADLFATEVKIKVASLPEGCKDANEAIKKGLGRELVSCCFRAKEYQPEKLELGTDVSFEEVYKPIPAGVSIPNFPKTMGILRGLRPEEMTLVLAPAGVGKTTFCREVTYSLLNQGKKVANIFLEEKTTKTRQGLIALDNNVPLWKFRENPRLIPEEDAKASYDRLIGSGNCHFVSHRGSLSDSSLLSLIRWYAMVEGVQYIVLDHISMVFSGRRSDNERVEIDGLLTDLAALVEETGVHLIVVAHIKRVLNKIYMKDEENNAEWLYIDLDAARGAGSFEQLTWNLITLEPEKTELGERGRTRISVRKNREIGTVGAGDIYKMDPMTGRLCTWQPQEYDY